MALALTAVAVPAQVLISPVVVEMTGTGRPAVVTVTLSDKASRPVRLQAQTLSWEQGLAGEAVTRPTDDLMVSPALAELRPGQKQIFRVAQRKGAVAASEKAYRLILEDVAEAPAEDAGLAVRFRMRYDLAVLVAPPAKPSISLLWKPCPAGPSGQDAAAAAAPTACLRVVNAGTHRVKLQALQVEGEGWSRQLAFKEGANLLAGAEREWRVPAFAAQATVRTVRARTVQGEMVALEPAPR
jgi:fimbrial chaperone protein